LLPDSRGHGRNGGELVTFGVLEKYDVLDWVRWMRAEGCTHIYALGESLGGSVLIQTVAVDPVFRAIYSRA
jgi:esterase/lipase